MSFDTAVKKQDDAPLFGASRAAPAPVPAVPAANAKAAHGPGGGSLEYAAGYVEDGSKSKNPWDRMFAQEGNARSTSADSVDVDLRIAAQGIGAMFPRLERAVTDLKWYDKLMADDKNTLRRLDIELHVNESFLRDPQKTKATEEQKKAVERGFAYHEQARQQAIESAQSEYAAALAKMARDLDTAVAKADAFRVDPAFGSLGTAVLEGVLGRVGTYWDVLGFGKNDNITSLNGEVWGKVYQLQEKMPKSPGITEEQVANALATPDTVLNQEKVFTSLHAATANAQHILASLPVRGNAYAREALLPDGPGMKDDMLVSLESVEEHIWEAQQRLDAMTPDEKIRFENKVAETMVWVNRVRRAAQKGRFSQGRLGQRSSQLQDAMENDPTQDATHDASGAE